MKTKIITGWPINEMEGLKKRVISIVNENEVEKFYIGRTNDLQATSSRHGCDEIIPIYKSDSIKNTLEVEDTLIKTYGNNDKCWNDADNSKGNISEGYVNYVYVAVWYH